MRLLPSTSHPMTWTATPLSICRIIGRPAAGAIPSSTCLTATTCFLIPPPPLAPAGGLKDYLDAHPNAIVVAPECNHEGNKRLEEYCPYDSDWFDGIHGTGKQYMDWLVNELKPAIDAKYPTLPDRGNTAIGGSSMGGLMSLYAITAYNKVFSKAACLSPSVRICLPQVKAELKKAKLAPDTRVYLSWGEKEGKGKHQLAQYTANALAVTRGLSGKGAEVYPYLQMNGKHCEADWRKQLGRCFKFLFGWKER